MTTSEEVRGDGNQPVSMIERAVRVLDAFDGPSPQLTLTEITSRTGLPRSSVHRILDQLVGVRWLERTGNHYRLGMRVLELGGLVAHHNRLHEMSVPFMQELHASTGQLVHLAVLDGHEIVYLEKIGGHFGLNVPSRVGGRQPAHCTAVGKAILAYADAPQVETAIQAGLQPRTPYTIAQPGMLHKELARIRQRGIAFDREESMRGIGCVAAPLRGAGRAVAAISVCGPSHRMNFEQLAPTVRVAAFNIWRSMFGPGQRSRRKNAQAAGPETQSGHAWAPGALDQLLSWPRLSDWM